jgi:Zn-dependent peptidase ImmA (M78 family)
MAERVAVAPQLLDWAVKRSGRTEDDLKRFPLALWIRQEAKPTMRQLEDFAKATYTPVGFFFLDEPPLETLPIPDFRTIGDRPVRTPTPNLLDTIYACEERQAWYRNYVENNGGEPVALVGSHSLDESPLAAADGLRSLLGFGLEDRKRYGNWTAAFDGLREQAEDAGVLVMTNGVVGSNTRRVLDPDEFRGFALVDPLAPVVFINGADTMAAQIFTLAHELCHVALGETALSKPDLRNLREANRSERWCNAVAAELLVPGAALRRAFQPTTDLTEELDRLARVYKVSTLVVLRRIADAGLMTEDRYRATYPEELERVLALAGDRTPGGSFYNTTPVRVSKRFARSLIADTIEGRTSHRDAFRLLGSKKHSAFVELGHRLGVA